MSQTTQKPATSTSTTGCIGYVRSAVYDPSACEAQRAMIQKEASRRGFSGSVPIFIDNGVSGNSDLASREGGSSLLEFCASHPRLATDPGIIIVRDFARIGRSASILRCEAKLTDQHGWTVVIPGQGVGEMEDLNQVLAILLGMAGGPRPR